MGLFKMKRVSWVRFQVLWVVFLMVGCTPSHPPVSQSAESFIDIGEVQTLTGGEAEMGIAIHQGVELAIEQINATGGVLGKKLRLITLDDQGKPDEAATAVTKLITQNKVSAVIGASASSRSIAIAAIAQKYQVPMMTPTSTHPKVTEMGEFIFRVCYIDSFQGQVMAQFALQNLHAQKIGILKDQKSDYSVGLTDFFTSTINKKGGEIVLVQSYSSGDLDFKSQLTAMRAKKPDAIYIPGYYSDVALIARQARELGITVPLLGGDGWSSPKLVEIGGSAINHSYYTSHFASEMQEPQIQKFVDQFQKKYHVIPNGLAALGYDSASVLMKAIEKAKELQAVKIQKELTGIRNFPGLTGKISIDAHRNAQKSAVVLKIEEGHILFDTQIEP